MLQQQQQISLVPAQPSDVVPYHQQHHHQLQPQHKAFVCEICGKAFRFRSNLAEHRSVHTAVKPFVCKFCGKSSRLKGNLTKHILKHHKIEQKEYIGTEDYIIKKGKKSVKDPAAIEFLEKSMIILNNGGNNQQQQQHFVSAPGSHQSVDSGGTEQQNGTADLDGQGILLSLGLDSGSLDLKGEEAMDDDGDEEEDSNFGHGQMNEEDANGLDDNAAQPHELKQYQQLNNSSANERLLEHCESAICSGDAEPTERRHNNSDGGINESDADGTGAEDCSGAESQSSGNQTPVVLPAESAAGTNALAAAACKALLFGQIDNKMLAKTLLTGSRTVSTAGQKDPSSQSAAELSKQQQQQATSDEIMRILQQVSSLTDQQQQRNASSTIGGTAAASAASASTKLATQCQLCGKHFRKPRDLIAHLDSNAHKFSRSTLPTAATSSWSQGGIGTNPLLIMSSSSSNGTPIVEEALAHNVQQQQQQPHDLIGRFFKDTSPTLVTPTSLTSTTSAATRNNNCGTDGDGHQQHLVANELRELRNTVADLRTSAGSSSKLEQMIGQLDSRVCRLEKQLDMALNSIYTLVQLQTGINNSVQKLASITPNIRPSLKTEQ